MSEARIRVLLDTQPGVQHIPAILSDIKIMNLSGDLASESMNTDSDAWKGQLRNHLQLPPYSWKIREDDKLLKHGTAANGPLVRVRKSQQ